MMKWMLCLLLGLALPGLAQTPNWQVDVQVIRVQPGHKGLDGVQIYDADDWQQLLRSSNADVLESGSLVSTLNHDGLVHAGRKVPIPYSDPRTGGYQVQYVDSGLTLDAKVNDRRAPPGHWMVDCRVSRFNLVTENSNPLVPGQDGFSFQSRILLKPGQVAVVATSRGRFGPQYLKRAYANSFGENDTLLIAIGVRKL